VAGVVAWAGPAAAGPAVIAAAHVEAYAAPSQEASVMSELGQGAPVCVLDRNNYTGTLLDRTGWLAIRLPGGVGYVPAENIDLTAPAPEVANCDGSVAAPPGPAPVLPPGAAPVAAFPDRSDTTPIAAFPRTGTSEPAPALDRPALLPGGFVPLRPVRLVLDIGSGMQWLDKRAAAANHVSDSGVTLNSTVGFTLHDIVTLSAAFSLFFLKDDDSFSEEVMPLMGGGTPHTESSSLVVGSYSVAAGLRTPFWALGALKHGWAAGSLFAQLGTAGVSGNREIANCVDCRLDHIAIAGGTFWRVGVDLFLPLRGPSAGSGYGLTASYEHYLAGAGLGGELRIGLSYWL
jgi:hypothetical protein